MGENGSTATRTEAVLNRIRAARFADGVACPRCGSARVYRWGRFSGRQRYRCRECRRTFSDLTGTPAAYVKKLWLWEKHAVLVEGVLTLRQVAAALGIHLSTAFDWRHRVLSELDVRDPAILNGSIQLMESWFPYSRKGTRDLHGRARRRGVASRTRFRGPQVTVVVACDEKQDIFSALLPRPVGGVHALMAALASRISGPPMILTTRGPLSAAGLLARVLKGSFRWVRAFERHELLADAQAYTLALRRWLRRFCGVATHYLPNYLAWHRSKHEPPLRTVLLSWPVSMEVLDREGSAGAALAA